VSKPLRALGQRIALVVSLLAPAAGCQRPAATPPAEDPLGPAWFGDATGAVGLKFVHDAGPPPGEAGRYFMPQSLGSGAALFDFDGDGLLDIYLLQNGGPRGAGNQLLKQLPGGTFQDVSAGSGLDVAGYNMGVAVGDVNNDGRPDVLITQYGGVRLFLNNGDGTFADVTQQAGLSNPAWGTSAAFLDYDRDGWLDLVIVNYVDYDPTWPCPSASGAPEYCGPSTFPGRVSRLFHNVGTAAGRGVRFQDVTVASGLAGAAGPGLGVVCADFDGDGWPDIFIANDGKPNHLWINRHDGTFAEEAVRRGVAYNGLGKAQGSMGVALGDVDGDGRFDLLVTHLPQENNTLWRQETRGLFRDQTAVCGLAGPRWHGTGFGAVLGDFDNDGALDLAVVNGRIDKALVLRNPSLGEHWGWYGEQNQLFANDGAGRFRDVSARERDLCITPNVARGLAAGDVFNSGALDLLVTTIAAPARLYRNIAPGRGHWLLVRATDPALGGRDAYGAEVRVRAGGRCWVRWVNPGSSYLCSHDPRAHFGLGAAECVDGIDVLWPDGCTETFPGGPADRMVALRKGEGAKRAREEGDRQ
jgi:hypothetical protein